MGCRSIANSVSNDVARRTNDRHGDAGRRSVWLFGGMLGLLWCVLELSASGTAIAVATPAATVSPTAAATPLLMTMKLPPPFWPRTMTVGGASSKWPREFGGAAVVVHARMSCRLSPDFTR